MYLKMAPRRTARSPPFSRGPSLTSALQPGGQLLLQANHLAYSQPSCLPNVYLEQIGVYTNRQTTGPTRSPMNMQAIFALESHMDRVAAELGMDPWRYA